MNRETREQLGFLQQYLDAAVMERESQIKLQEAFEVKPDADLLVAAEKLAGWSRALSEARQILSAE